MSQSNQLEICPQCRQPMGQCNIEIHERLLKEIDPRYRTDPNETIMSPWYEESWAPKLTQPQRGPDRILRAEIPGTRFEYSIAETLNPQN